MDGSKHQVLPVRIVDRQCCARRVAYFISSSLENSYCRSGEEKNHVAPGREAMLQFCMLYMDSCMVALQGKSVSHSWLVAEALGSH